VHKRKLVGFCCVAAVLALAIGRQAVASSDSSAASASVRASTPDSAYLVREVVYNELNDHDRHGYWRYWIERYSGKGTKLEEAVETPDGPVARLELSDGHALDGQARAEEDRKLRELLNSPGEQAQRRKAYTEDEHRIGRILVLLPEAFL